MGDHLHMRDVAIIGIGQTAIGELWERGMRQLAFDALSAALAESGVERPDALFVGNMLAPRLNNQQQLGAMIADFCGWRGIEATTVEAACASGGAAFQAAVRAVASGMLDVAAVVGRDLFTDELRTTLMQFEQAKNFGSLIVPKLRDPAETLRVVEARDFGSDLLLKGVQDRVGAVLRMAEALSPKYHVVVANPPYMGGSGMNSKLADFLKLHFEIAKSDLFSAFIIRNAKLSFKGGQLGYMTPFVWMFIARYERLRNFIFENQTLTSLVQLEYSGFDGATVPICTFTVENGYRPKRKGAFVRLADFRGAANQGPRTLEAIHNRGCGWFYTASAEDFERIPGAPVAYWASDKSALLFQQRDSLSNRIETREGLTTGSNDTFLRLWHEVCDSKTGKDCTSIEDSVESRKRWFPCVKGGDFRRWYGNLEHVVNWFNDGAELRSFKDESTGRVRSHNYNGPYAFRPGFTWTGISSATFSVRQVPRGLKFDTKGPMGFALVSDELPKIVGYLNSRVTDYLIKLLAPTLDFKLGHVLNLPLWLDHARLPTEHIDALTSQSKSDWDSFETSWDFTTLPLLSPDHRSGTLEATYARLRAHWAGMTDEMQRLEEENNRIFIDAYGLQDELTPEVPIEEITLTCNPAYRYGVKGTEEEREARLLADTMKELISYAIGCMFGRYSLDAPGLILANQGDTAQTYLDRIPNPTFAPDRDNVIPLLEEDWFADDAYQRFREFLSVTFGADRLVENLEFMRAALGKEVRTYLAKDFYADHVQGYKKRPIYWLVSSPKGAFQALIYMHRYTPDTLNITLNDYVRGLRDRLEAALRAAKATEISPDATPAEKNRAKRDIDRFTKQIAEVTEWERDTLYPLAVERIRIDLDDGVKRNYPKFPGVLRPIKGLEDEDA